MKDLKGLTFGNLTVIKLEEIRKYKSAKNQQTKAYWLTQCTCGVQKVVRGEHLTSGRIISCRCFADKRASERLTTHNMSGSPEYRSWVCMKARVLKPDALHAKYYSDVSLAEDWHDFSNFYKDMGDKPTPKHEIDRINPFGDYEPSNCRWVTRKEQMNNLRKQYI